MAARKKSSTKKSAARKRTSSSKSARKPSDALALLKADHQLVQKLFDQFEKTRSDDRKRSLAEEICRELTIHTQIEEEIFYPAAREALRDQDLLDEATVEHASAKDLIAQIESASPGEELFDARVKVLGEYVKHHVKEEQNELFPKVRKSKLDLKGLGEELQDRKMALQQEGGKSGGGAGGRLTGSRAAAKRSKGGESEDVGSVSRTFGLGAR